MEECSVRAKNGGAHAVLGFVDAKSYELARDWAVEDLLRELQKWCAWGVNAARWAQKKHSPEYFEGYADALGDVLVKIEELRRELR